MTFDIKEFRKAAELSFRVRLRPKLSLYHPTNYWFSPEDIKKIEKAKKAKFLLETSFPVKNGGWSHQPLSVFYSEEKHPEGSNYFAMWYKDRDLYITNGLPVETMNISGIVSKDCKYVIYSRYVHDFVTSPDGSVSIDGGRDYTKFGYDTGHKPQHVRIVVKDGVISFVWPQEEAAKA